jgi:hypothetical protein
MQEYNIQCLFGDGEKTSFGSSQASIFRSDLFVSLHMIFSYSTWADDRYPFGSGSQAHLNAQLQATVLFNWHLAQEADT